DVGECREVGVLVGPDPCIAEQAGEQEQGWCPAYFRPAGWPRFRRPGPTYCSGLEYSGLEPVNGVLVLFGPVSLHSVLAAFPCPVAQRIALPGELHERYGEATRGLHQVDVQQENLARPGQGRKQRQVFGPLRVT